MSKMGFLKRKMLKAQMKKQYSHNVMKKLKQIRDLRNRNESTEELAKDDSMDLEVSNENLDLPSWIYESISPNKGIIIPPVLLWSDQLETSLDENTSQETEEWEEVPVPSRRGIVEVIPPEEERLTEEEERLKVLLENFHLSKRERPVPPPQEESHSPIDREWYDALIWRENRRKHSDGDCLITRVVRQSKLTEFFKPKKNN